MDGVPQSLGGGGSGDPLVRLFKDACTSGEIRTAWSMYSRAYMFCVGTFSTASFP